MESKSLILITGITGFIGNSLINKKKFLNNYSIIGTSTNNYFKIYKEKLVKIDINEFTDTLDRHEDIKIIHLATFYSLLKEDKNKINDANLSYGKRLLKTIDKKKIKKIINFNSMFAFSDNPEITSSIYVSTKKEFSIFINNFSSQNNILYDEIYLDNTFGLLDKRDKVVPIIISSILNNNKNPIQHPEKFINLIDVTYLIDFIFELVQRDTKSVYALYSKNEYNLASIYKYMEAKIKNTEAKTIEYRQNEISIKIPNNIEKVEIDFDIERSLDYLITNIKSELVT